MKILFIVNPVAGKNKAVKLKPFITQYMKERQIDCDIVETMEPDHGRKLASKAKDEGYDIVVAVGGDGTVYEVVNGAVNSGIIVGIIPAGTGNDLARTLKIPQDIVKALEIVVAARVEKIDLGKINGHHFINVASVGFDCEVVIQTQKYKKYLTGLLAYMAGVFKCLISYKPKKLDIYLDQTKISEEVFLVAVANGKYYGGGMKVAPGADILDGYFDVCVIKNVTRLTVIKLLAAFIKGEHIKHPKVKIYRAKQVQISSPNPQYINADGEIIGNTPIKMECISKAISVIIP